MQEQLTCTQMDEESPREECQGSESPTAAESISNLRIKPVTAQIFQIEYTIPPTRKAAIPWSKLGIMLLSLGYLPKKTDNKEIGTSRHCDDKEDRRRSHSNQK